LVERLGVNEKLVLRYPGRSVDDLAAKVFDLTVGRGVAAAFDFAGGEMKALCFKAIGFDGHIISVVEEGSDFKFDIWSVGGPMFQKSASYHLVALSARSRNGVPDDWSIYRHWIDEWLNLVSSGKLPIQPVTDLGMLTEDNLTAAHEQLQSRSVKGKLALTVDHAIK
jgi:NADPH:quinone reductase-like Zn-dependent oxidoreductase